MWSARVAQYATKNMNTNEVNEPWQNIVFALIGEVLEAAPGTIRSDYAIHTNFNLIHGADSLANAEREIAIFFSEDELVSYDKAIQVWI